MDSNMVRYDFIRYFFIPHPENFIKHLFKTDSLFRFSAGAA